MSKIFISHSSRNNACALAVAEWLAENGWCDFFLDVEPSRGLAPGERWQQALKRAAHRCEAVLFLISPAWRDSHYCRAEFLLAKHLGKTVFGILIEPTPFDTLPPEMAAEWQLCDLIHGSDRRVFRVSKDSLVAETDVSFATAGLSRLKIGLQRAGLDPSSFQWPPAGDCDRAPYRGLKALDARDAAVFFGREADIVRGLDALRLLRDQGVEHMLVILGASGSGKSSFLRAGLWPRLERDDRHFLPLPVIRPERAVLSGASGLAAGIEEAFRTQQLPKNRTDIRAALQEPGGLARLLAELRERARSGLVRGAPAPTIVIPVDQAEELSGAEGPEGRAEADAFMAMLAATLQPKAPPTPQASDTRRPALAVVAIRSDSYERLQTARGLEGIVPRLFSLPPISRAEYICVIEGPAKRAAEAGVRVALQPALTRRLLEESEGADALPLLAFTLERLFIDHQADGDLSLKGYEALGGVRGSLEAAVAAAFARPTDQPAVPADRAERERLLRQAFVPWLAGVDLQTEERKRRVARWNDLPRETLPLIERLVAARLLVQDRRKPEEGGHETIVVEVAHEALLRQWPALAAWLDEDAGALKALEAVRRAAGEWKKNQAGEAWLVHGGERLAAAEEIGRRPDFHRLLGSDGNDYLKACRERDERAHRERQAQLQRVARAQRRVAVLLALIALILAGAGSGVVLQSREVGRQTSLVLAAEAKRANDQGLHDRALRYAVMATRSSWLSPAVPEAEAQLARAAHASLLIARLGGHEREVNSAVFSRDGQRVVSASGDGTARIWDAGSGQLIARLEGHEGEVHSASFSPDGKLVTTASDDGTARIWDAATGNPIARLDGHQGVVRSAAFSWDSQRVVTSSGDSARVWRAASGQPIARLQTPDLSIGPTVFSMDGERVMAEPGEGGRAWVWDVASRKEIARFGTSWDNVRLACFSANGQMSATAIFANWAEVLDVPSGRRVATLDGHGGIITSLAFSANGNRIVTASEDKTARVWETASGRLIRTLEGHGGVVRSAAFSPDGLRVVTISDDMTVRVWDATSGRLTALITTAEGAARSAAFSPDSRRVVTTSADMKVRIWDASGGRQIALIKSPKWPFRSVRFTPDGQQVVTDNNLIWDAASGKQISQIETPRLSLEIEGRRSQIVVRASSLKTQRTVTLPVRGGKTAQLWDAASGKPIAQLDGHKHKISSVAFNPDGDRIVTASDDRTARIWDANNGNPIACLAGHEHPLLSASFSPDGRHVLTASSDKTARIWDANNGNPIACLAGHKDGIRSGIFRAVYSLNGQRVFTDPRDGTAMVWDSASGRLVARFDGRDRKIVSADLSPDGQRILTASKDTSACVWDAASSQLIARLDGHEKQIVSAGFSPDSQRVVTASLDNTARVWDARWLTHLHGNDLIDSACREKMGEGSKLTAEDVRHAAILSGRVGEDVCAPPPLLAQVLNAAARFWPGWLSAEAAK